METLREGMTGDDVTALQTRLQMRGFPPGAGASCCDAKPLSDGIPSEKATRPAPFFLLLRT
jgi:hypothetical protein